MGRRANRWIWIVGGILVAGLLVTLIFAGVAAYVVMQGMDIESSDEASAERTFEEIRMRFAGQEPLLEAPADPGGVTRMRTPTPGRPTPTLQTLNLLAWDPSERKLVRFALPFWIVRMKGDGVLNISSEAALDFDRFDLRISDLERHGPGLVLDQRRGPDGTRVLIWTE